MFLNENTANILKSAAPELNEIRPERRTPSDTLTILRRLIEEARSNLLEDEEIDLPMREFLLSFLFRLEMALDRYSTGGIAAIRYELDAMAGYLITSGERLKGKRSGRAVKLVKAVVAGAFVVVAAASDFVQLAVDLPDLLRGEPPAEIVESLGPLRPKELMPGPVALAPAETPPSE